MLAKVLEIHHKDPDTEAELLLSKQHLAALVPKDKIQMREMYCVIPSAHSLWVNCFLESLDCDVFPPQIVQPSFGICVVEICCKVMHCWQLDATHLIRPTISSMRFILYKYISICLNSELFDANWAKTRGGVL